MWAVELPTAKTIFLAFSSLPPICRKMYACPSIRCRRPAEKSMVSFRQLP
jgi:hypothetical protein